jgi:Tfp pilus assembly protein PilZ
MTIKLALACKNEKARQAYVDAVKLTGVEVDIVSSLNELHELLSKNAFNGVMVDLNTKVKASKEEKAMMQNLLEQFPLAQLNFEEKTGHVRAFHFGQACGGETLGAFINEECRSFSARPLRLTRRAEVNFNVLLIPVDDAIALETDRTVTINVSEGGCFFYFVDGLTIGSRIKMVFKELGDKTPILGDVRWQVLWGDTMQIPGIGVRFEEIRENQLEEICRIGNL